MEDNEVLEGITQEASAEETTEEALPTIEELKAQIAEGEAARTQLLESLRKAEVTISKHQGQTDALAEINKRMDGIELNIAKAIDVARGESLEDEEIPTRKPTEQELVKQRQEEARNAAAKQEADGRPPGADEYIQYALAHGLAKYNNDKGFYELQGAALDAVKTNPDPKEALKILQSKIKEVQDAENLKRAEELANQKYEARLKELGLTTEGVTSPSAASQAWRDLEPGDKILAGIEQGKQRR